MWLNRKVIILQKNYELWIMEKYSIDLEPPTVLKNSDREWQDLEDRQKELYGDCALQN